jgi:hypothetical protein
MKKYVVRLSQQERKSLRCLIRSGKGAARTFTRAHILLKADVGQGGSGWNDQKISEAFDVTVQTVERVRKQLVEEGLEAVLRRHKYTQKVSRKKVDGDVEAHLIALSCGEAPEGYSRWSLRLLAGKMVELGYVESISHEAVRQTLKKRVETVAAQAMVHCPSCQCGLCLRHGGCPDRLQTESQRRPAPGLYG